MGECTPILATAWGIFQEYIYNLICSNELLQKDKVIDFQNWRTLFKCLAILFNEDLKFESSYDAYLLGGLEGFIEETVENKDTYIFARYYVSKRRWNLLNRKSAEMNRLFNCGKKYYQFYPEIDQVGMYYNNEYIYGKCNHAFVY